MAQKRTSTKRLQLGKTQANTVSLIAVAVFVTVFSLVSCRALWQQRAYQAKVIGVKKEALQVLEQNTQAVPGLVAAYKDFVSSPTNIIDGNPNGTGEKDGDNARIILDALPSKYDFPALATSLEKLLIERNFKVESIKGIDDEVAQSANKKSGTPKPVAMPYQITVDGSYSSIQDLLSVFERSIRPFSTDKLVLKGSADNMQMILDGKTYYQPEKTLDIQLETVK